MERLSTLPDEFSLLREELGRIPDRRHRRGKVHPLGGGIDADDVGSDVRSTLSERDSQIWRYSPNCTVCVRVEAQSVRCHSVEAAQEGVGVRSA